MNLRAKRCVEQWHHEERFIGILGASVRLQSRSPLVLRTFSFECDGAAAVRVPLRLVTIVRYTILRMDFCWRTEDPAGREFPTNGSCSSDWVKVARNWRPKSSNPPHYSKNFGHKVGTLQKCPASWKGRAQTKVQAQAGRPGRMSKGIDTSGLYFFFSYV